MTTFSSRMRIGLYSAFPFRPHVEHLAWLGVLARAAGHEVVGLSCDGSSTTCYSRELLKRSRMHCIACTASGLRAFPDFTIRTARGRNKAQSPNRNFRPEVITNVRSIMRLEDPRELDAPEPQAMADRMVGAMSQTYSAVRNWIETDQLDALLVFNGRMDLTRAAILAAADSEIPFVTVERGSFDTGLRIFPGADCQALRHEHRLQREYAERPLLRGQALVAASLLARRVLNRPISEWRTYNSERARMGWPGNGSGLKVLIGPSSRYEMEGEPERELAGDPREIIDRALAILGAVPGNVVVRGHPVWAEPIAGWSGNSSTRYYGDWCKRMGYCFIPPEHTIDSLGLMQDADVVISSGGTIGLEAASLGRPTISIAPCFYAESGCVINWPDGDLKEKFESMRQLRPVKISQRALRALYTHINRFTQFVGFARPVAGAMGALWEYRNGATFDPVASALQTGWVGACDSEWSESTDEEARIANALVGGHFEEVLQEATFSTVASSGWEQLPLNRWATPLVQLRRIIRKGDRLG